MDLPSDQPAIAAGLSLPLGPKAGSNSLRKAALTGATSHMPPPPRSAMLPALGEEGDDGVRLGTSGGVPARGPALGGWPWSAPSHGRTEWYSHLRIAWPAVSHMPSPSARSKACTLLNQVLPCCLHVPFGRAVTMGVGVGSGPPPAASSGPGPSPVPWLAGPGPGPRRQQVALGSWDQYWDQKLEVQLDSRDGTFNVYTAGSSGPVVLCLHGGGYTGVTWSLVAQKLKDKYRVVAPDMRGHGDTSTSHDNDFSKETMSEDVVAMWEHLFGAGGAAAGSGSSSGGDKVPTVIVGHSMGGGLAVWAAAAKRIPSLEGIIVIDVVEGTALAALPHMAGVVNGRPTSFPSLEEAAAWSVRSGMCRNRLAAGVSMPSQLRQQEDGSFAWRTPLLLSQPYWEGWYTGLSDAFLQVPGPKMLLLAGTDRLDRQLTIGQMQGKFQLVLMPTAGHAIQEDEPDKTAEHVLAFLKRFRVGEPPLQFPRAPAGTPPVLPVVAGPVMPPR